MLPGTASAPVISKPSVSRFSAEERSREADTATTAPVAIVNQAFVRRFFRKEDPIDKRFGLDMPANAGTFRVVGVVRDAKYTEPQKTCPADVFRPVGSICELQATS